MHNGNVRHVQVRNASGCFFCKPHELDVLQRDFFIKQQPLRGTLGRSVLLTVKGWRLYTD